MVVPPHSVHLVPTHLHLGHQIVSLNKAMQPKQPVVQVLKNTHAAPDLQRKIGVPVSIGSQQCQYLFLILLLFSRPHVRHVKRTHCLNLSRTPVSPVLSTIERTILLGLLVALRLGRHPWSLPKSVSINKTRLLTSSCTNHMSPASDVFVDGSFCRPIYLPPSRRRQRSLASALHSRHLTRHGYGAGLPDPCPAAWHRMHASP